MKKHDPTSDLTDFGPTSRPLLLIGHLSRSQCDKSNLKELWLDVLEEEQNLAVSLHDRHPEKFSEILRIGRSTKSRALLRAVNFADTGDWQGADGVLSNLAAHYRVSSDPTTRAPFIHHDFHQMTNDNNNNDIESLPPYLQHQHQQHPSAPTPTPAEALLPQEADPTSLESVRGALGLQNYSPGLVIRKLLEASSEGAEGECSEIFVL